MAITNEAQLKFTMMSLIEKAMKFASDKITYELSESVRSNVATREESKNYSRTGEFFKSVIVPKIELNGNFISVTLGMDSEKMQSVAQYENLYNAHMSMNWDTEYLGKSIPEWLLSWWDEGTNNIHYGNMPRTNYWQNVMGDRGTKDNPNYDKMFEKFNNYFQEYIQKIGIVKKT